MLLVDKDKASAELKSQISKGKRIAGKRLRAQWEIREAAIGFDKWIDYTVEVLTRFFDQPTLAKQFKTRCIQNIPEDYDWRDLGRGIPEGTESGVLYLQTIRESLHLYELATLDQDHRGTDPVKLRPEVFVVHGHDHAAKETVARYLESKLGLRAIILHEQANRNRTVIEKLEKHSDVQFAVVILTPDDWGCPKDDAKLAKPRARQNVIFELGYFIGKLGRDKVCALYTGDVEWPSDYHGVLYLSLDQESWRTDLAREIKAAGLQIDLNNVY